MKNWGYGCKTGNWMVKTWEREGNRGSMPCAVLGVVMIVD